MGWTGAFSNDWSYFLIVTGRSWTGMMTQTSMTMGGMTTGPGVVEVATRSLIEG